MKQKNLLWLVAVALLLPLFALTACSDDDDDDNANTEQTSTNGTTTLSKKVTKIVCTCTYYSEEGESEAEETYLFDTDGKIISMLRDEGKDTFLYTYTYTSNQIIVAESGTFVGCIYYNLENGRITESVYEYKDNKTSNDNNTGRIKTRSKSLLKLIESKEQEKRSVPVYEGRQKEQGKEVCRSHIRRALSYTLLL